MVGKLITKNSLTLLASELFESVNKNAHVRINDIGRAYRPKLP
jgi:hypothetical protein